MPKVPWTLRHPLSTRLTLEIAVYRTHVRIHEATNLGFMGGFIHDLWMFNFGDRVRFLPLVVKTRRMRTKATEKRTISSGERMPNCTSRTLRTGAAEYAN